MLREPKSLYEGKRSSTLLKVKSFEDIEVKVVGHTKGKGRIGGTCGALICEMKDGKVKKKIFCLFFCLFIYLFFYFSNSLFKLELVFQINKEKTLQKLDPLLQSDFKVNFSLFKIFFLII